MNVASPDWRSLSPEDLQLLYTVGDLLSIAVERARLFDRSARLGAVEERNRLAREIHDTLAQGLTATGLQLESAEALLDDESGAQRARDRKSTRLNSSHANISYAVFCLKKKPHHDIALPTLFRHHFIVYVSPAPLRFHHNNDHRSRDTQFYRNDILVLPSPSVLIHPLFL